MPPAIHEGYLAVRPRAVSARAPTSGTMTLLTSLLCCARARQAAQLGGGAFADDCGRPPNSAVTMLPPRPTGSPAAARCCLSEHGRGVNRGGKNEQMIPPREAREYKAKQ